MTPLERQPASVDPTCTVADSARLGEGVRVWQQCQIFDDVVIGAWTRIGSRSVLGAGTRIGERCKLQNDVFAFGAIVGDEVFIAPRVTLVEDRTPRATTVTGQLVRPEDWTRSPVRVERGASIGVGSIILPGVTVGEWALVAGGSVCSRSVPRHALVAGNPARQVGHVCVCGKRLDDLLGCECGLQFERADDGPGLRLTAPIRRLSQI